MFGPDPAKDGTYIGSTMAHDRRHFVKLGLASTAALVTGCVQGEEERTSIPGTPVLANPIILSTWKHGLPANARAMEVLNAGGSVLDAVEQGVAVVESDFTNRSVGLGGLPDRDGKVTLDACIQDHDGRAGAVAFIQEFEHPISIARSIMERTPHVLLVGAGAERWALENGFSRRLVEIPEVRQAWREWLLTSEYKPGVNTENLPRASTELQGGSEQHDTIGMIAMDATGRMAGSCTTSGLAWKVHGRVGDSPIIGAGLFVDGDGGAACATGVGELVIRTVGSHAVVERMRQGAEPEEACREAILAILRKNPELEASQVGFLAIRKDGLAGGWGLYEGFNFALSTGGTTTLVEAAYERKW
jgi:isoaspartyl peptidase/L-asparaginase-like protein (Ntn-hydrolase superfamily)